MFNLKPSKTGDLTAALTGLLQGIAVYLITEHLKVDGDLPPIYMALVLWLVIAPFTYVLTRSPERQTGPFVFSFALATLGASLYLILSSLFGDPKEADGVTLAIASCATIVTSYVAIGFFRARQESGNWTHYPALFEQLWNLPILAGISFLFYGISMGIFFLWGALFKLIEIDFFADIFDNRWFVIPAFFTLLALGISITRDWEKVINTLGGIAVALLRLISVILFGFSALFLVSLLATGLEPLWEATSATVTTTLMVFISALIITAVVATGDKHESSPHIVLQLAARGQALLLPAFAGIAVYSLSLRIDQYGWNVSRIFAGLFVFFAIVAGTAYALSALLPRWQEKLRMANMALALVAAGLAILVQTPLLNPFGISAKSQMAQLTSGKIKAENFDFAYLKFKLGKSGQKALAALEADTDLKDHDVILARIEKARERKYYRRPATSHEEAFTAREVREAYGTKILIRPEGHLPPEKLTETLSERTHLVSSCIATKESAPCLLAAVELFGDDTPEYILLQEKNSEGNFNSHLLYNVRGRWQDTWVGNTKIGEETNHYELWVALEAGAFSTVDVNLKALQVGETTIIVVPDDRSVLKVKPAPPSEHEENAENTAPESPAN